MAINNHSLFSDDGNTTDLDSMVVIEPDEDFTLEELEDEGFLVEISNLRSETGQDN
jgi:hypothetical protein